MSIIFALFALLITLAVWIWLLATALPEATSFGDGVIIFTIVSLLALCVLTILGAIGYFATIIGNIWADIERRHLH